MFAQWVEGSPKQFNIPRNITKEGLSRKANEWVKDSIATTRPTKSGWKLGDGPIMIDDIGMRSLRYVSQGSIELELVFLGQVSRSSSANVKGVQALEECSSGD